MKGLLLTKSLKQFRWDRLRLICGEVHEGKIGEWIRWWVDKKIEPYGYQSRARMLFSALVSF